MISRLKGSGGGERQPSPTRLRMVSCLDLGAEEACVFPRPPGRSRQFDPSAETERLPVRGYHRRDRPGGVGQAAGSAASFLVAVRGCAVML